MFLCPKIRLMCSDIARYYEKIACAPGGGGERKNMPPICDPILIFLTCDVINIQILSCVCYAGSSSSYALEQVRNF